MEAVTRESSVPTEEQSSFGIKKIVDCKIGEGGRQMYKVKWEPTWEPAENLASCQHLIDEFWSFVNKAKTNEEVAQQHRKRMRLEQGTNMNIDQNFDRMSDDNKADVQRLIARANATSVGNQMLMSPSNLLMASPQRTQQNNLMGMARTPTHASNQNFANSPQTPQNMRQPNSGQKSLNFGSPQQQQQFESPGQKGKFGAFGNKGNVQTPPTKVEADDSPRVPPIAVAPKSGKTGSNTSTLKYIENFDNQYVKIILVCKICNKEQSLKFSHNWKTHYLSHVSDEEKPHKCQVCPRAFVTAPQLKKHMKQHQNVQVKDEQFKMESSYMY